MRLRLNVGLCGLAFTALVLLFAGHCLAREAAEQIITKRADLSSIFSRRGEWIAKRWVQNMGVEQQCVSGESYKFDNGQVFIERCDGGKVVRSSCDWSLNELDDETVLNLCSKKYLVRARVRGATTELSLSGLSDSKATAVMMVVMKFIPR